jgi:O-methyltransferase
LPVPLQQTTDVQHVYLDLLKRSLTGLDGDMYESTAQAIEALYPKLSPGGYSIVDDFGSHQSQAAQAIIDYRNKHGIDDEIVDIDGFGAYWRRKA